LTTLDQEVRSNRDDFVFHGLPMFDAVDSNESRYLAPICQATKGVQFADERNGDGMIAEFIATANATVSHCAQMPMERPDDGDDVHSVLNLTSVGCCFSLCFDGPVGDGCRHRSSPQFGFVLEQKDGMVHQYVSLSVAAAN